MDIVYLNGEYRPKAQATISVMDRGFLFGDSIYEVIPLHNGKLIGCKAHFERMQRSLAALKLPCPFPDYDAFKTICMTLIDKNNAPDTGSLYFQVSRGAEEHRQHRIPADTPPTVVGFISPTHHKTQATLETGFKAVTHTDLRRDDNYIKSTALMSNVSLYDKAVEKGAVETILLRNGYVMECTASNLFIVKNNILMTPPLSDFILAGVTRSIVLELARQHQVQTLEIDISHALLRSADEIWVTGSVKEICPIVQLDDQPVGTGQVGPYWRRFYQYYQDYKESHHD